MNKERLGGWEGLAMTALFVGSVFGFHGAGDKFNEFRYQLEYMSVNNIPTVSEVRGISEQTSHMSAALAEGAKASVLMARIVEGGAIAGVIWMVVGSMAIGVGLADRRREDLTLPS